MAEEVALIVGGGPGISASCARLFASEGMKVAVAARNIDKDVLKSLAKDYGITRIACDASDPESVAALYDNVTDLLGAPTLVVHNIDGRPKGRVPKVDHRSGTRPFPRNIEELDL